MNEKVIKLFEIGLSIWILLDVIFLTGSLTFEFSLNHYYNLIIFDTCLCVVLFLEFFFRFFKADDKNKSFKENWTEIVAAIPFDLIMLPFMADAGILLVLRFFKFIRILILFSQLFEIIGIFLKNTYLDEILSIFLMVIISFTLCLYLFDPSMNNLFDSLWFVVSTLTTVGYGDILPTSLFGKVITLVLLIFGVLIFSAVTAAMASYFNKKLLYEGSEELKVIKSKLDVTEKELMELKEEIAKLNEKLDDK